LFRDEVLRHEMLYFDQILSQRRSDGSYNITDGNVRMKDYKPPSSAVQRLNNCIMDESRLQRRTSSSPCHFGSAKQSKKHHVRSKNKRDQANRKLIEKAKLSSRKMMRKFAIFCKSLSRKLERKISAAIANMHFLLEEGVSSSQHGRSAGQEVERHNQIGNAAASNNNNMMETSKNNTTERRRRVESHLAPLQICLAGKSSWLKKKTQYISSTTIAKAKDSIRNRKKAPFIV